MTDQPLLHPHDKFFKDAFSRLKVVSSFVNEYLPSEHRAFIDISTLEAVKDSHINPQLWEFFSDAVFTAITPDGISRVYLLFEHKSYDDPHIGVQIIENIAMVLEYHRKQHGRTAKSPIIFPIIIYQSTTKRTFLDQPIKTLRSFENTGDLLPDLNIWFVFLELQSLPDNQIRGVPYLRILFLTLKYIHSPLLIEKIGEIIVIFNELDTDPDAPEYFEVLINYLEAAVSKNKYPKLQEKITEILNKGQGKMSRLLNDVLKDIIDKKLKEVREEGIEEGIEKGFGKGIEKGIEKGKIESMHETVLKMISLGIDNDTIGKVSGYSIEKIEEIRKAADSD